MCSSRTRVLGMVVVLALLGVGLLLVAGPRWVGEPGLPGRLRTPGEAAVANAQPGRPDALPSAGEVELGDLAPDEVPAQCPSDPRPIANPTRITLVGHGLSMPMITVGAAADGTPGVPPDNEGYTVAWFNQGPQVGADAGRAVLSGHTFRFGGALGNQLNNGLLQTGDVVVISGADGATACYRYSGSHRVLVSDYDPDSDILHDYLGSPQIGLVVCSDYALNGEALGRVIHYGDLITGNAGTADQPS